VVVSALSGMITAARKRMDVVGTYCLAVLTAFGGGTLRDLLVDQRPFFWVRYAEYLVVIFGLCMAFVYSRPFHALANRWHRSAVAVDALGLALFTLTGLAAALRANMPLFVASLIGVITGTFGGVLRDIVVSEIPELFRPGSLYAVSAFAGSWVYLGGVRLGLPPILGASLAFVTIVVLRLVSVRFGVRVPDPLWLREDTRRTSAP
jgi:uncharacterized membrane protein YeiH